ncbi:hypothetical protein B0H19DRAFT_1382737 [Mycena capillaripes]|nr:hypothetical protein B0H19DRAFT_1382737 [Mycena capillaripes]
MAINSAITSNLASFPLAALWTQPITPASPFYERPASMKGEPASGDPFAAAAKAMVDAQHAISVAHTDATIAYHRAGRIRDLWESSRVRLNIQRAEVERSKAEVETLKAALKADRTRLRREQTKLNKDKRAASATVAAFKRTFERTVDGLESQFADSSEYSSDSEDDGAVGPDTDKDSLAESPRKRRRTEDPSSRNQEMPQEYTTRRGRRVPKPDYGEEEGAPGTAG